MFESFDRLTWLFKKNKEFRLKLIFVRTQKQKEH